MTRRQMILGGAAAPLAAVGTKNSAFPSDWRRYSDPTTENEVFRLTGSDYTSLLPEHYNFAFSRRGNSLVFACDRAGSPQVFRMELATGKTVQLSEAAALDPASVAPSPDGRAVAYFDGRALRLLNTGTLHERTVYTVDARWERCAGLSVSGDGAEALFAERQGERSRLRGVSLLRRAVRTVVEAPFQIQHPIARPLRAQILYRQGDQALWLVNGDGSQNRRLKLAEGTAGAANWAANGRTLLYLRFPTDRTRLNEIHEHTPDTGTDKLVAKTSQFVHFGFNRDTSVFVGASRNAASPTVLLLVRAARREFTLCEHKATNAVSVAPRFSPDSQRIYFQSDRHGKPAIYCMHVEKLVEKVEAGS